VIKGIVLPTPILKSVGRRAGGSNVSILKHWPNCRICTVFFWIFLFLDFYDTGKWSDAKKNKQKNPKKNQTKQKTNKQNKKQTKTSKQKN
jgi:hypothetical protein